ncbi:hypothetical protein [Actinoplanes sp. NPDC049599]|uniref:hypothetical protein n=1 Tax=Actinoplanes sp. NPDC049599 TaxID=3363903 RepID=UPI00378A7D3D
MDARPADLAALVDQILTSSPSNGGEVILPWPHHADPGGRVRYRLRLIIEPIDRPRDGEGQDEGRTTRDISWLDAGRPAHDDGLLRRLADAFPRWADSVDRLVDSLVLLQSKKPQEYSRLTGRIRERLSAAKRSGITVDDDVVAEFMAHPDRLRKFWAENRQTVIFILATVAAAAVVGAPLAALARHESIVGAMIEEAIKTFVTASAAEIVTHSDTPPFRSEVGAASGGPVAKPVAATSESQGGPLPAPKIDAHTYVVVGAIPNPDLRSATPNSTPAKAAASSVASSDPPCPPVSGLSVHIRV